MKENPDEISTTVNTEHFWVQVVTQPSGDVSIYAGPRDSDSTMFSTLHVEDHFPSLFNEDGERKTQQQLDEEN